MKSICKSKACPNYPLTFGKCFSCNYIPPEPLPDPIFNENATDEEFMAWVEYIIRDIK